MNGVTGVAKDYKQLTRDEAWAVMEEFLAERQPALDKLRSSLSADGIDPDQLLDDSVESLTGLWAWIKPQLRSQEQAPGGFDGWLPTWNRHDLRGDAGERTLSYETVLLLDGVVTYISRVIMKANPDARWTIGTDGPKSFVYHEPLIVTRRETQPAFAVAGQARRFLLGEESLDDTFTQDVLDWHMPKRSPRELEWAADLARMKAEDPEMFEPDSPVEAFYVEGRDPEDPKSEDVDVHFTDLVGGYSYDLLDDAAAEIETLDGVRWTHHYDRGAILLATDWTPQKVEAWFTNYLVSHIPAEDYDDAFGPWRPK